MKSSNIKYTILVLPIDMILSYRQKNSLRVKEMISAIIPIFNAENKLETMLKCIARQTYRDYEVILINDGSIDNSEVICKKVVETSKQIRYFYQKNAGVSAARNYGIREAKGEYITFLDADDSIDDNYFQELLKGCNNADIAVCDVVSETEKGEELLRFTLKEQLLTQTQALNYLLTRRGINSGPCAKLFKKDIVENICFPSLKAYEDILFVTEAFSKAERIAVVNHTSYHYIQNMNGTMQNFLNSPSIDIVYATEKLLLFLERNKKLEPACEYITFSHLYQYIIPLLYDKQKNIDVILAAKKIFRKYYRHIFFNTTFTWKEKVIFGLFCVGWIYRDKVIERI